MLGDEQVGWRSVGFTLIEMVVVLLVLSILGAVGVPKFIDLQSKAAADKCQHHRAMLTQVLHDRSTLEATGAMTLNKTSSFSTSVNAAVNEVMTELGGDSSCRVGSHCDAFCPTDGAYYKVSYAKDANDFLTFYVTCQVHGGEVGGDTQIGSQSNAMDLMKWLTGTGKGNNNYEMALWENGKSLDNFFTKYPWGSIDSEAMTLVGDYAEEYANLPVLINKALAASGLDMKDVVWRLSRDQLGVIDGMWNSRLVLVMADKSAPVGDDGKVTTTVIKTEILYVPGEGNPVESFANLRQSSGKATLVTDPATGIVTLIPD